MSNGPFQPGTWIGLPSNCTSSYTVTYYRCAEWGLQFILQCLNWTVTTTLQCIQWGWEQTKKCSWWSWIFCVLFAIILTAICLELGLVVIITCAAFTIIELVVCLVWSLVSIIFCLSKANGGTAFLLTDGTVMMQEFISVDLYFIGIHRFSIGTNRWWKLTPDAFGSYANGTWSRLADSNVARTYYASGVLADGRVVVCGGEYSPDRFGMIQLNWNNTCEIYDRSPTRGRRSLRPQHPLPTLRCGRKLATLPVPCCRTASFLLAQFLMRTWRSSIRPCSPRPR